MAVIPVTIPSGQSLSAAVDLCGAGVVAVITPSGWDAAAVTFQCLMPDGASYGDVFDSVLGEISVPAANIPLSAWRRHGLPPLPFEGVTRIKVRSGVTATSVSQTADRTLFIITRAFA